MNKMLMQGDFDLNSVQSLRDSREEVIKQTMVNQDVLFRKQLHELHRLYGVQKSLMKDPDFRGDDQCNSWNVKAKSCLTPPTNKYELLVKKETRFPSIREVHSTPFLSHDLLEVCRGTDYGIQKRPVDLQLSADEFIKKGEENLPNRGRYWNCSNGHVDFRHPIIVGKSSEKEDLNLSLSVGNDNIRSGGTTGTLCKKMYSCFQNVIDLEESLDEPLDVYEKFTRSDCASLQTCIKDRHGQQVSAFSDLHILSSANTSPTSEISESNFFQEKIECHKAHDNEGKRKWHDDVPCNNISTKKQQFSSYQRELLDLNRVHADDSFCYLNDPSQNSLSGVSDEIIGSTKEGRCPTTFCEKEFGNNTNGTSDVTREENLVDLSIADSDSNNEITEIGIGNVSCNGIRDSVGSLKVPLSPVGISENHGSCSSDHKNENVEQVLKVANSPICDSSTSADTCTRAISSEKSEAEDTVFSCLEQCQNTYQDGQGGNSPPSVKSYPISDNDSSSAKTMQSVIKSNAFNQYSEPQLRTQLTGALLGELDVRTSVNSETKIQCGTDKEEPGEVNILIKRAAESLIHISLENSICHDDSHTKGVSKKMDEINDREKSESSCDSFELFTLNLTETNVDDNSVSSNPYEVNYAETKEFSLKLRRGRRMKDFQREILPGLASLSRHEIREDINIMEGVLRSREYRKMRSKMATCGEKWSAPVRSRRSRLNYVRRRIFS